MSTQKSQGKEYLQKLVLLVAQLLQSLNSTHQILQQQEDVITRVCMEGDCQ
jgi:hypothetical protein